MSAVVAEKELYRSCQIIFGSDLDISREFLEYIQWSGVKSAYRKRAMETHPDRVATLGEHAQRRYADLFKQIQDAYENLVTYIKAREQGYRLPSTNPASIFRSPPSTSRPWQKSTSRPWTSYRSTQRQSTTQKSRYRAGGGFSSTKKTRTYSSGTANSSQQSRFRANNTTAGHHSPPPQKTVESLYSGPMPKRKLMMGHYLYYSGKITWRMIVQALVWQRTQRPRLGEIGRRLGMLKEDDIKRILKIRTVFQPFGESAVKLGLLSDMQLRTLLSYQQRLQKKFGQYFVEKGIVPSGEFEELLKKFKRHNAIASSPYIFKF